MEDYKVYNHTPQIVTCLRTYILGHTKSLFVDSSLVGEEAAQLATDPWPRTRMCEPTHSLGCSRTDALHACAHVHVQGPALARSAVRSSTSSSPNAGVAFPCVDLATAPGHQPPCLLVLLQGLGDEGRKAIYSWLLELELGIYHPLEIAHGVWNFRMKSFVECHRILITPKQVSLGKMHLEFCLANEFLWVWDLCKLFIVF